MSLDCAARAICRNAEQTCKETTRGLHILNKRSSIAHPVTYTGCAVAERYSKRTLNESIALHMQGQADSTNAGVFVIKSDRQQHPPPSLCNGPKLKQRMLDTPT